MSEFQRRVTSIVMTSIVKINKVFVSKVNTTSISSYHQFSNSETLKEKNIEVTLCAHRTIETSSPIRPSDLMWYARPFHTLFSQLERFSVFFFRHTSFLFMIPNIYWPLKLLQTFFYKNTKFKSQQRHSGIFLFFFAWKFYKEFLITILSKSCIIDRCTILAIIISTPVTVHR